MADDADAGADGGLAGIAAAEDIDFAFGGLGEPGENAEEGGFAGTVAAQESDATAGGKFETHLLECGKVAVVLPEAVRLERSHLLALVGA